MKGRKPGAETENEPLFGKILKRRTSVAGRNAQIVPKPCTTPILPWFEVRSAQDSKDPPCLDLPIVAVAHPVSARQLAATLWDVSHYPSRSTIRRHKSFVASPPPHSLCRNHGLYHSDCEIDVVRSSFDQATIPGSLRMHHHPPIQRKTPAQNPESPATYISSSGGAPYNPVLSPTRDYRGKTLYSERSMKTSTGIIKVPNRVERGRETEELKRFAGEVESLRIQVEHERRLRKHSEDILFKLAQDLSDLKFCLSKKAPDHERESLRLLEELCGEFACGIEDYEHKVHGLKQKRDPHRSFLHGKGIDVYDEAVFEDYSGSDTQVYKIRHKPSIRQAKFEDQMAGASSSKINHKKGHLLNSNQVLMAEGGDDCDAMPSSSCGKGFGTSEWMENHGHRGSSKGGENLNYGNSLMSKLVEVRSKGRGVRTSS